MACDAPHILADAFLIPLMAIMAIIIPCIEVVMITFVLPAICKLPQTKMKPETDPFKEDSSPGRIPSQVLHSFARV